MKLTIEDRLIVSNVLPSKGSFEDIIKIKNIRDKVAITAEEIDEIEFKTIEGKGLSWNKDKAQEIEIELTAGQIALIQKALEELNKKGELTVEHIDTYQKFSEA